MNISLIGTRTRDYTSAGVSRITRKPGGEAEAVPIISASKTSAPVVYLAAIPSLTAESFTLPFTSKAKIASSLRTRTLPYQAAGELEVFTTILNAHKKSSSGVAWYCPRSELEAYASLTRSGGGVIWPAPLALISRLDGGTGVTMWEDGSSTSSVLWKSYAPVLYRWSRNDGEHESEWYDVWCEAEGAERGETYIFDARECSGPDVRVMLQESVKLCTWLPEVNLSISALEDVHSLERTVKFLTAASVCAAVWGCALLGAGVMRLLQARSTAENFRTRSEAVYREVFEPSRTGRISNPVMLARDKIASLAGHGTSEHTFSQTVRSLGEIWSSSQSFDVRLDIIRYNSEGLDCTGTAPGMSSVLAFRKAWEERGVTATVDNTQAVSGIGYRFDMRVRWQ